MQQSPKLRISAALCGIPVLLGALVIWSVAIQEGASAWSLMPLAVGPFMYFHFAGPWIPRDSPEPVSIAIASLAAALFVAGFAMGIMIASVLGWMVMVHCWSSSLFVSHLPSRRGRLALLLLFSFPWISHDVGVIGELFQWSGAVAAELIGAMFQLDAHRSGNNLFVRGTNLSIGPACSGMDTLQITMLCGSVLAVVLLVRSSLYWLYLPILIAIAWLTNTLRIAGLVFIADASGSASLVGEWHDVNGYVALLIEVPLILIAFFAVNRIGSGKECGAGLSQAALSRTTSMGKADEIVGQVPA